MWSIKSKLITLFVIVMVIAVIVLVPSRVITTYFTKSDSALNDKGQTPLDRAVKKLDLAEVKSLIKNMPASPNSPKTFGKLLINTLSVSLNLDDGDYEEIYKFDEGYDYTSNKIVKFLICRGAMLNLQDYKGNTPLSLAISGCACWKDYKRGYMLKDDYFSSVKALIKAGANVNIPNKKGDTPLHMAARYDLADCAKLLIEHGAKINTQNAKNVTPLTVAISNHSKNTEKLLRKTSAKSK